MAGNSLDLLPGGQEFPGDVSPRVPKAAGHYVQVRTVHVKVVFLDGITVEFSGGRPQRPVS